MQQINQGLRGRVEGCRLDLREIDRLIAEKVMGWETQEFKNIGVVTAYTEYGEMLIPDDFSPSEDIQDAWVVVEKLRESKTFLLCDAMDKEDNLIYCASFQYNDNYHSISHEACTNTAPMAICLAALKAVGVEVEVGE